MTGKQSAPVAAAGEDFRSLGEFGSIDGFVELRRRGFCGSNPLLERQQTLSDLRGNVAVVHERFQSVELRVGWVETRETN